MFESHGWAVPGLDPATAPTVDVVAEALTAAVDKVLAESPDDLPAETVLERQRVVMEQIERLRLAALHGLRAIDTRELYAMEAAGSAAGWLRAQPMAADGLSVTAARALHRAPTAVAESAAGRLSVGDVQAIATAVSRVPVDVDEVAVEAVLRDGIGQLVDEAYGGAAPARHQARLAEAAVADAPARSRLEAGFTTLALAVGGVLPPGRLRVLLADLVDALLPEQHDARAAKVHEQRQLSLQHVFTGGWHLRGFLDDDTGELLDRLLATRAPGPGGTGTDDVPFLTATQARHDALHAVLEAARDGKGNSGSAAGAQVVVVRREESMRGAPGSLPARLGSGARLAPRTADRLSCGGALTRVLLGSDSRPLDVGRSRRLASSAQRTALGVQWGGLCATAGCAAPGSIPHHVVPWTTHGGSTDLADLVPLCPSNHHDIHTGRRVVRLKDGRLIGPDGWVARGRDP